LTPILPFPVLRRASELLLFLILHLAVTNHLSSISKSGLTRRIYDAACAGKPFDDEEIFSEVISTLAEFKIDEVSDTADLVSGMAKLSSSEAEKLSIFPEKLVKFVKMEFGGSAGALVDASLRCFEHNPQMGYVPMEWKIINKADGVCE
jgi:hypothetical protein